MRLEVKELRIGNYYDNNGKIKQVTPATIWEHERIWCEPIPLTEEWLLKLGFEKGNYKELDEKHFVEKSNTIKVIISGVGFWDVYTDYNPYQITFSSGLNIITDNKGINHVHQLQNLYYALTGEELTIKNQ